MQSAAGGRNPWKADAHAADESPQDEIDVAEGVSGAPMAPGRRAGTAGSSEPEFTVEQAVRTRAYWVIASAVFVSPLIGTAFLFDMQPIVALRGMDKVDAANVVSAWTATMAIMAIPSGWLTDRLRPSRLIALGSVAIAASAGVLWAAGGVLMASAAMCLFAIGQTLVATCAAATTARYFGRRAHGAIRSSITRLGVIGTGLGPVFTGLSKELTGGYGAAMLAFVLMCVPVVVVNLRLRPPGPGPGPGGRDQAGRRRRVRVEV